MHVPLLLTVQRSGVPPTFQLPLTIVPAATPGTVTMTVHLDPWLVDEPVNVCPPGLAVVVLDTFEVTIADTLLSPAASWAAACRSALPSATRVESQLNE